MLVAASTSVRAAETVLGVRSLQLNAASLALEGTPESDAGKDPTPMNRWNLGYRAVLELAALGGMGTWGFDRGTGISRYLLMAGIPVIAAATWGIFAVEGDPSRSGQTVVSTPGAIRLGLELAFFGFSAWTLRDLGYSTGAYALGGSVVIHYAFSYERILWLLSR